MTEIFDWYNGGKGAKRAMDNHKPQYDMVPDMDQWPTNSHVSRQYPPGEIASHFLDRMQIVLDQGAAKYGRGNWQKGIPLYRYFNSCMRHILLWRYGDTKEDHLAAAACNIMMAMMTEQMVIQGKLSSQYLASRLKGEGVIGCVTMDDLSTLSDIERAAELDDRIAELQAEREELNA